MQRLGMPNEDDRWRHSRRSPMKEYRGMPEREDKGKLDLDNGEYTRWKGGHMNSFNPVYQIVDFRTEEEQF